MRQFRFARISMKLLGIFVFILGVVLIGLFALLEAREYYSEREDLVVALERLTKTQSVPVAAALWEYDTDKIASFLSEIVNLPFVQGAIVTDSSGDIVATKGDTDTSPKHADFLALETLVFQQAANSETIGSIEIIAHDGEILRNVTRRIKNNATVLLFVLMALTAATFFATNIVVGKPLRLLLASIERIHRDGVRQRVDWDAADELGQVIGAYNEMQSVQETTEEELRNARDTLEVRVEERTKELAEARDRAESALADLKNAQAQLIHSQKMASLGELTAGIAHEIKNPLNFVNNFAETSVELVDELKQEIDTVRAAFTGDARESIDELVGLLRADLGKVNEHGRRADGIVKSMLLHSRGESGTRTEAAINPMVSQAVQLAYHGERAKDKTFQVTLDEQFEETAGAADVVAPEITRVLVNLLGNAFHAVKDRARQSDGEDYEPRVQVTTKDCGDEVEIRVRDNGTGIPHEAREKLFNPFFTTKPAGEGTGLGLSLSFDIVVRQHDGRIDVESEPGNYTEFSVMLPRRAGGPGQIRP